MVSDTAPAPARRSRRPLLTRVVRTEELTPHMRRIVLTGEDLVGFGAGAFTDHYVKLQVPPQGADYSAPFDAEEVKARVPREHWPRTRTYSVRHWDADANELTIDFVVHGDTGVAGPWAAAAQLGDQLQLSGPGGAYSPDPAAAWHLLIGDASVLPAICASLARVPAGVPVLVVVEVAGPAEEQPLETPGALQLSWVPVGSLLEAVSVLTFPDGEPQVFLHGEATAVREVRKHLVLDRGLPASALSASGYWKQTRDEEGWREDKAAWNAAAVADVAQ